MIRGRFTLESTNGADIVHAPEKCCPRCRDPRVLETVIKQFNVEGNPRYKPRDVTGDGIPETFCNVFATDVAQACGVVLPHWWRGREYTANALYDWLGDEGAEFGWEPVDEAGAVKAANEGRLALAIWQNPNGPGHVAVVIPSPGDTALIAQAGRTNFYGRPVESGFGRREVKFYVNAA